MKMIVKPLVLACVTVAAAQIVAAGFVEAADYDGDGVADLAIAGDSTTNITVLLNRTCDPAE